LCAIFVFAFLGKYIHGARMQNGAYYFVMVETASWAYSVYPLGAWIFAIFVFALVDRSLHNPFVADSTLPSPELPPKEPLFRRITNSARNSMGSLAAKIPAFNGWLAMKFGISARRIFQIEFGVIIGTGFTMMQIGEHLAAIVLWIVLCFLWVARALAWSGVGQRGLTMFLKTLRVVFALFASAILILVTIGHRGNEPWSNLGKLIHSKKDSLGEIVNHPYDVSGKRGKRFIELLKPGPGETDTLRIGCLAWSDSACDAAGHFLLLLSAAGWPIDSNRVFPMAAPIPLSGVFLASRPVILPPPNLPPHLGMWEPEDKSQVKIAEVFSQMSVPVKSLRGPELPVGTLGVYFGPDPGPQVAKLYMMLSGCEPGDSICDEYPRSKTSGTFLTSNSDRQVIEADHPECVQFQVEASDRQFVVAKSDLPQTLKIGRCVDHACSLTVIQFLEDKIVVDSRGTTFWDEEDKKMASVPIHWKLLGAKP
jgi:hypothetical protein